LLLRLADAVSYLVKPPSSNIGEEAALKSRDSLSSATWLEGFFSCIYFHWLFRGNVQLESRNLSVDLWI
jgi:hypothetical protein